MIPRILVLMFVCVCRFYSSVGDVNVDTVKKLLADNKQVKLHKTSHWVVVFVGTDPAVLCWTAAGRRDRLVPAAQELGAADDVQREGGP